MRRLTRYGVIVAAGMLAAGCSAGAGSSSSPGSSSSDKTTTNSVLTISNENGALWTCGFNPLNSTYNLTSVGFIYEPLVYVNPLQSGKTTPMLATSWAWGAGNKSLTFTIRQGVKWSDGTPMTAADVAYTFNLIKKYPALDLTGVWSVLSSVTATSPSTVTMDFSTVAVPYFYYIADQTPIVPQHIWSTIANPATASISNPIGTGPYLMSKCSPQNITYTANPHYWQPGLPRIHTLEYPAFTSNNTANDTLASGQAQWGAQYIPDIEAFYTSKNPNFHYWFPPILNVSMVPNLTNPLLSNVKVREAISYAIDRSKVSTIGESGYEPPANQTGVVTPTFSSSLNSQALASWGSEYDVAKATSLLESAGYHMSGGVMTNAAGQKLQFTVINIGDYSDWVASMQVIQQDLKAVGISITPDNLSNTDYEADLFNGHYQLGLRGAVHLRPGRVLRAEQLAQLREHGAGRQAGRQQLRALQQPGHRRPAQAVLDHHGRGHAAVDPEPATAGHAEPGADHPRGGGRRLVPVRHHVDHRVAHVQQPLRPASGVGIPRQRAGAAAPVAEVSRAAACQGPGRTSGKPWHAAPR